MRPGKLSGEGTVSREVEHAVFDRLAARAQALALALGCSAPEVDVAGYVCFHILGHGAQLVSRLRQRRQRLEVCEVGQVAPRLYPRNAGAMTSHRHSPLPQGVRAALLRASDPRAIRGTGIWAVERGAANADRRPVFGAGPDNAAQCLERR